VEKKIRPTRTFRFITKLFNAVRPRKLLYIAVDGVAPRAKMNQQRSRRFRTAKDSAQAREGAALEGRPLPANVFDSNAISPGTELMCALTEHIKFFVQKMQTDDPMWRAISVVFSGQEVPGEGEHKIMEYLRQQRTANPEWDHNQVHCLYGLDADLIILGLLTHEHNVAILREESLSRDAIKAKRRDIPQPF
jgi:5'-3' exoribonuclease 1